MQSLTSKNAPAPIGPYSQAVISNNLVFCSGQLGLDAQTNELKNGVAAQTEQVLLNLLNVLKEAGLNFKNVVRCDIFLIDLKDFIVVNEIYAKYFNGPITPARQTVQVSALPKGALVEISCIAVIEGRR